MPTEKEMPSSQTSAPVKPPDTTEEVRRDVAREEDGSPTFVEGDEVRGDRMPRGADEPGAGL